MTRVAMDTNVLVSALLKRESIPALALSLILNKKAKLCPSEDIFTEYKGVLAREKFRLLNKRKTNQLLAALHKNAFVVQPKKSLNVARDPDDNKFLECAVTAKADFIVTGNTKHFPKTFRGIKIVTPREFVVALAG